MALVWSVSAVQIRRCLYPIPSCTKLPSFKRIAGICLAVAASTICAVEGPKQWLSTKSCKCSMAAVKSKGVLWIAANNNSRPAVRAARPTFSWRVLKAILYSAGSAALRVLPKPVFMPAKFWSSNTICSKICAAQVPSCKRSIKPPRSPTPQRCSIKLGSQLVKRSVKPSILLEGNCSKAPISTHASITGRYVQMLGPFKWVTRTSLRSNCVVIEFFSPVIWPSCSLLFA